jgi:uncharacterized protein (DUF4415 family)
VNAIRGQTIGRGVGLDGQQLAIEVWGERGQNDEDRSPSHTASVIQVFYRQHRAGGKLCHRRQDAGGPPRDAALQSRYGGAPCAFVRSRLDQDIVDRFFEMAEQSGGATGYQTLINAALLEYLAGKAPRFEDTPRRIVREELKSSAA